MKTAAVICEYNPFHNGHAYQLSQMREQTGADFLIAVMSGNFVQRGEAALFDKYTRAEMALTCGADLVLELPPMFSSASAREFASAGVMTCLKAGIVDTLCFGTEQNVSPETLDAYAKLLLSEATLKAALKEGRTYPEAVSLALAEVSSGCAVSDPEASPECFRLPNNILALEYLRAIRAFSTETTPLNVLAIPRVGAGYHEINTEGTEYASATGIRALLRESAERGSGAFNSDVLDNCIERLAPLVPKALLPLYRKALGEQPAITPEQLSLPLSMRLLDAVRTERNGGTGAAAALAAYPDVSAEIAHRLANRAERIMSFEERIRDTKTRQYTYSRISRALLHIVLGITTAEMEARKQAGYISYLNVLGFRKEAAEAGLLRALKEHASVPVITKTADHAALLGSDLAADQLYYALTNQKGAFERSPVIL